MTLREALEACHEAGVYGMTVSGPKAKAAEEKIIKIRPVMLKNRLLYQITRFRDNKAFHDNKEPQEFFAEAEELLRDYRQLQGKARGLELTVLSGKKGSLTVKLKKVKPPEEEITLSHNREKQYILDISKDIPFLKDLGIQTTDNRLVKGRQDKFSQINRFLELTEDVLTALPKDRKINIVDFGCGKSYLTFALYYYLHDIKGYDLNIYGLDLKADVIKKCNELTEAYGYRGLKFYVGDIKDYIPSESIDMVVTLHACDTATDYALHKAVRWDAGIILSVPCCQHELNSQIDCEPLNRLLSYGIIKERTAALFTDALRAEILRYCGFEVQIIEFTDMEHTPKNLMLRCIRKKQVLSEERKKAKAEEITGIMNFLGVRPTLAGLLLDNNS